MFNLKILNLKIIILIVFINKIYSEIIPIHIGSPNHRNFQRTPTKNENNLRGGLIPVGKNQINTLIQPTTQNDKNQNFEYSKRIGLLGKRSTYTLQNTRNQIDHSNYDRNNYLQSYTPSNNLYEKEKQKIFNYNEMNHYSPNTYQPNIYQPNTYQSNTYQPNTYQSNIHQPKQYGYIFNGNSNTPQYNSQYGNQQQFFNQQPIEQHYNQQRDNLDYNQQQQHSDLELNDLDNFNYDMPFGDQQFDNNNHLFNDAMNFDMPNLY